MSRATIGAWRRLLRGRVAYTAIGLTLMTGLRVAGMVAALATIAAGPVGIMAWATAAGLLILAAAATAVAAWAQVMLGEILADRARDELLDIAVDEPDALGGRGAAQGAILDMQNFVEAAQDAVVPGALGSIQLLLGAAALVLVVSPSFGIPAIALLALVVFATGILAWTLTRQRAAWHREQEAATLRLMDRLVGQRTVAAQEALSEARDEMSGRLRRLRGAERRVDRCSIALTAVLPRCYLLLGLVTLAAAGAGGSVSDRDVLIAIGLTLLCYQSLHVIAYGAGHFATATTTLPRTDRGAAPERRPLAGPAASEHHIFADTLAFNVLLGRDWPPRDEDITKAEHVCIDLGLEPLLDAMPARMYQPIGEGGWRLSQGQRQLVVLARDLLGDKTPTFDEPLAHLDPTTARRVANVLAEAGIEMSGRPQVFEVQEIMKR